MKEHFQVVFLMKMVPAVSFLLGLDCLSTHSETSSKLESQCIDTVMTKYPFILGMACFSK